MIKVEVMSFTDEKSMFSGEKLNYIKQWGLKNFILNCKITPDRKHIYFYDEKSFEEFKKTFQKSWKRIY